MWQRFTERARKAIFYAQEEAGSLGESYVSTEHLLLGIIRDNDNVASSILVKIGVNPGAIRSQIERQVARGDGRLGQDMQLTKAAQRVIELAYHEARELNNNYIGTEHLLLGLIRDGEGLSGRVLSELGVDLDRTRLEVMHLQAGGDTTTADPTIPRPVVNIDVPHMRPEQAAIEAARHGASPWQRFTERARKVILYAQEEAGILGEHYISTEHLLLGVIRENDNVASTILAKIGVNQEEIRSEIQRQVARFDGRAVEDIQLTPRAKRVIDLAYHEARQFNHDYIGTEHLLLGLVRESEGLAGRVLRKMGVDLDRARHEVSLLLDGGGDTLTTQSSRPETTHRPRTDAEHTDCAIHDASEVATGAARQSQYTKRAQTAIDAAIDSSNELGWPHWTLAYLALAILSATEGAAARLLMRLNVDCAAVAAKIDPGKPSDDEPPIPLKAHTAVFLAGAKACATFLGDPKIGTDHLLFALVSNATGGPWFAASGLTADKVIQEMQAMRDDEG